MTTTTTTTSTTVTTGLRGARANARAGAADERPAGPPPTAAPASSAASAEPAPTTPPRASDASQQDARRRFAAQAAPARVMMFGNAPAPLTFASERASLVGSVKLGKDGKMDFDTGIRPYTRSYAQAIAGPLRHAHGSPAPASSALTDDERAALAKQTPGQALDAMARALSADGKAAGVAFEAMANSKDFFDPSEKSWWGLCAQWSWSSLSQKVNDKVDVPGPEGQRGAWLAGQWLSRADLGNWAMASSKSFVDLAMLDSNAQSVHRPGAVDLVKSMSALRPGGPGMIIDVHNDTASGTQETWNQPVFAAKLDQRSVPKDVETALLARAAKDGHTNMTTAKLMTITAKFGIEKTDAYEGDAAVADRTWNAYVVANADGDARWGYMADDPKIKDIPGLPVKHTDAPPDYLAMAPTKIIDEAMAGGPNAAYLTQHKYGAEMSFFMGTVLKNMVPGPVRAAFEAELAAKKSGALSPDEAAALAKKYPGVANAYSPEQWQRAFGPRGLDARAFATAWTG